MDGLEIRKNKDKIEFFKKLTFLFLLRYLNGSVMYILVCMLFGIMDAKKLHLLFAKLFIVNRVIHSFLQVCCKNVFCERKCYLCRKFGTY